MRVTDFDTKVVLDLTLEDARILAEELGRMVARSDLTGYAWARSGVKVGEKGLIIHVDKFHEAG